MEASCVLAIESWVCVSLCECMRNMQCVFVCRVFIVMCHVGPFTYPDRIGPADFAMDEDLLCWVSGACRTEIMKVLIA